MSELDLRYTIALLLHKADTIAVAIADLSADVLYTPTSNVPAKHKVAPCDFPVGDPVRAYGVFGHQEQSNFCPGLLKAGYTYSKSLNYLWRTPMKKLSLSVAMFMLSVGVLFAQGKIHARAFTGAIMDSQCASMGNHDAGYKMTGTTTPKDCTLACVKAGGQFVLYNAAKKSTYKLDNQTKPRDFAGENVKVIGTYNSSTKTIHVEKIEAAQ